MINYEYIIMGCWAAFILVWIVSAFNTKLDIRGKYGNVWQKFWLLRLVALVVLLAWAFIHF